MSKFFQVLGIFREIRHINTMWNNNMLYPQILYTSLAVFGHKNSN